MGLETFHTLIPSDFYLLSEEDVLNQGVFFFSFFLIENGNLLEKCIVWLGNYLSPHFSFLENIFLDLCEMYIFYGLFTLIGIV